MVFVLFSRGLEHTFDLSQRDVRYPPTVNVRERVEGANPYPGLGTFRKALTTAVVYVLRVCVCVCNVGDLFRFFFLRHKEYKSHTNEKKKKK